MSAARLRVLWVCPYVPWPLDSGGKIRVQQLLRALVPLVEVHLFCVLEPGQSAAALEELRPYCASVQGFARSAPGGWRALSRPKLARWFHSSALCTALKEALGKSSFDLLHLEELLLLDALPPRVQLPLVQHHQKLDLEFARALAPASGPSLRQRFDLWKLSRLERASVRRTRRHVFCSQEDRALFEARHGPLEAVAIPSGYDPDFFRPGPVPVPRSSEMLLFLGSLDYAPNLDALDWLLERIWPPILAQRPSARLCIAGRAPGPELRARLEALPSRASVELCADVPDVRPLLASAALLCVPLRIGGGSRLKLVEALALGTPVLSTRVGAAGLELEHGRDLLLADSAQELSRASLELLSDPGRAQELGQAGQRQVEAHYRWPLLAAQLARYWRSVAGR